LGLGDRDYRVTFAGDFTIAPIPFESDPALGVSVLGAAWLAKKALAKP